MQNAGPAPVTLARGERIAQLVFAAGIGFGPATVLLWMLSKVRPLK